MKVILVKHHQTLGAPGDVRDVADGYARNFLLARGLAIAATPAAHQEWQDKKLAAAKAAATAQRIAKIAAKELAGKTVTMTAKANDHGTLFAAITPAQIAAAASTADVQIDPAWLVIASPVKQLGTHQINWRIGGDLTGQFNLEIVVAEAT